jgi:N6-adenosine-specific RNA methylase IME4
MIYTDFEKIPHNKYEIVYADPPWKFQTWSDKGRGRCPKYDTMTVEEMLEEFPLQNIIKEDCALFMWGTWPKLETSMELLNQWGFTYKTGVFDWGKVTKKSFKIFKEICEKQFTPTWEDYLDFLDNIVAMGTGYWSRSNSEYCLLGTTGKPKRIDRTPLVSDEDASLARSIRQLLLRPRGKHSEKPDEVRQRIVTMMGDIPRIELFDRDTSE